jgi:hypothetical protein
MSQQWQWCVTVALIAFTCTVAAQTSARADVYAALLKGNDKTSEPLADLLVKNVTIPMKTINRAESVSPWLRQWDVVPPALRRVVEESAPATAAPLAPALFPSGTRFATEVEIQSAFTQDPTGNGWSAFRRRFNAAGWLSVSDVIFSPDQSDALVYYEMRCGDLCGVGAYVWLNRGSRGSGWVIQKRIVSWVS